MKRLHADVVNDSVQKQINRVEVKVVSALNLAFSFIFHEGSYTKNFQTEKYSMQANYKLQIMKERIMSWSENIAHVKNHLRSKIHGL
jgi:hypothetical protein